jgi:hypothetical protein
MMAGKIALWQLEAGRQAEVLFVVIVGLRSQMVQQHLDGRRLPATCGAN